MKIKITELEKLVVRVLHTRYSLEEANLIKDVVLFGELSGKSSHGILRLLKENYGVFTDGIEAKPKIIKKTNVSSLIEGNGNVGMLVGSLAMREAIRLAKVHSIGVVGTKNSINTTGSLSYYCEKIAKENLIGIIFTQNTTGMRMAAFSSKKGLFGTNPLAFGIPSIPHPIIFDMSTSAITYGEIVKLKNEGKTLPQNVALDAEGNMTQYPAKALEGATLPFDNSYKGSGLAMMIEILAAVWTGASFSDMSNEDGWGNLYIALSPNLLSDVDTLKRKTQQMIQIIKDTPTRTGKKIRLPGEHTLKIRDKHLKKGEIEVDASLIEKIKLQISTI